MTGSDELLRIYGLESGTRISFQEMHDLTHPEDKERLRTEIGATLCEEHVMHDIECRLVLRNKTERHVHIHGTTVFNDNGQPITVIGTVQDITERKKTEEYLRNSDKLSLVGELAAGVAHEIRNPLTTLKGFLQLMYTTPLTTEKQQQYFGIMMKELVHIEQIASEMMVLAKPQVMSLAQRNILLLLTDVVSLLSTEALLHNVQLRLNTGDEPIFVVCEETQIKQVFVNIIKNAIEAMPQGGILAIDTTPTASAVTIQFTDNGSGIAPERIPKLGEPFYTTKEKGTGLGLMISHKIIQAHHGDLVITSQLGYGTTVTISLRVGK